MYEKCVLQAFSKSLSIFSKKNHCFFSKIVFSRVWVKRGNTQTHRRTNALIVWEMGGWGVGRCVCVVCVLLCGGGGRSNYSLVSSTQVGRLISSFLISVQSAPDTILIIGTSASPFWLQPPRCNVDTHPILHQNQEKEEPSSSLSQNLFHPGTFVPLPAFLIYIFFFPFRHKEARDLFFALCPPMLLLYFTFLFFFFLFHFFSCASSEHSLHFLNGAFKVLGSSPWLFI